MRLATYKPELKTHNMKPYPNITLAILAGGKATRMGGVNKALLTYNKQTFIRRIFENLSPLFVRTIIISDVKVEYDLPNVTVYSDFFHGMGPLGGVHASLKNALTPYTFVVSCDMPFVDSDMAVEIIEHFLKSELEILAPQINSLSEPLFAVYSNSLIVKIEEIFYKNERMAIRDLFLNAKTGYITFENTPANTKCFTNINSQIDFEMLCH